MADSNIGSEAVELSEIDKENKGSPEFKRLHSEDSPSVKRQKQSLKKSISWGSRGDALLNRSISSQPMTVGVFLVEKSGRLLNLEDGRNTTAGTINKIMAENLSLAPLASQVFCIWLISPLLQLQLKDHHRPFRLRKVWSELLRKFTNVTEEAAEKDEPILCYQRNSFFPLPEEKRFPCSQRVKFKQNWHISTNEGLDTAYIKDDRVLRRLFEEAKYNVLSGNYPTSTADALVLGGILAFIEHGKFNTTDHTPGFFKTTLTDYLPARVCKSSWSFRGRSPRSALEQKLLQQYEEMSDKVTDLKSCHRKFLEFCWNLPFYGSVFFRGQIERPTSNVLHSIWGNSDIPVRVGINRDSIHVIDDNKNDILLSLAFEELSWDYTPAPPDDPDCMDTFWLEFDPSEADIASSTEAQRLQIFSKQAVMMDAMVQSCSLCDGEGGAQDEKPGGRMRCRMERLSLSTLEGTLDRKKKSNLSFSNPFKKSSRQEHQ